MFSCEILEIVVSEIAPGIPSILGILSEILLDRVIRQLLNDQQ